MKKLLLFTSIFMNYTVWCQSQNITSFAGTGVSGFSGDGGKATLAQFNAVANVAVDTSGNVYICDNGNARLRKVNAAGIVTTICGNGSTVDTIDGGPATATELACLDGVAVDKAGNIYLSRGGGRIRKINPAGIISKLAGNGIGAFSGDGGPATAAEVDAFGIAVDDTGNVYFADYGSFRIRKINTSGIISTIAGNGTSGSSGDGGAALNAELVGPNDVKVDPLGNIYIADRDGFRIRKINTAGIISTFAGTGTLGETGDGGPATAAEVFPDYLATDDSGNVYYSSSALPVIRKINPAGIIVTVAGNSSTTPYGYSGPATAVSGGALGIAVDKEGNIYTADGPGRARVRKIYYKTAELASPGLSSGELTVFPNPNSGTFTLTLPPGLTGDAQVTITNTIGQAIKETRISNGITETELQLTAPPGVYIVTVNYRNGQGRWCAKLMIQ